MNRFTIRDIENLSGIKAHTWRIWEQRYSLGIAQRRESNHRFFDNDNLKHILKIAYLYNSGVKISKIAALRPEEMKAMALSMLPKESEAFYINELIEASLDLDEEKFDQTFNEVMKKMGVEDAILKIINPFQKKIGMLWLTEHLIPAQEHFTSNIIRQKLTTATNALPFVKNTKKKEVILFAPECERHEIALQFVYYLLRKNENKVIYFGTGTSIESIKIYQQQRSFTCLYFHLVTNLNNISPDEYLQNLSECFTDKQIVMSGPQVHQVTQIPKNVRLLRSVEEVIDFTYE